MVCLLSPPIEQNQPVCFMASHNTAIPAYLLSLGSLFLLLSARIVQAFLLHSTLAIPFLKTLRTTLSSSVLASVLNPVTPKKLSISLQIPDYPVL